MQRCLVIGLDREESEALRTRVDLPMIATPLLPRIKVEEGRLFVERPGTTNSFVEIHKVVYHGIFADDFDTLTGLALWGGPCYPSAQGLMDCRLRLPCLARALRVTRFGTMKRGYAGVGTVISAPATRVAKWGNWHCGENKELFHEAWQCQEPTVIEEFIQGRAVRIMIVGDRAWQIALTGPDWRKSIHPDDAHFEPTDPQLLDDAKSLGKHFGLEMLGVDYMASDAGEPHLLEVNHIPNVTRFGEIQEAFLQEAGQWLTRK